MSGWALAIAMAVIATITHSPSLANQWSYDDKVAIASNSDVINGETLGHSASPLCIKIGRIAGLRLLEPFR
jgi:hypothetical protein